MKFSIPVKTLLLLALLFSERIQALEESKSLNNFLHGAQNLKRTYKNDVKDLKSETTDTFQSDNVIDLEISVGVALAFKPFVNWPELKVIKDGGNTNKNFELSQASQDIQKEIKGTISSYETPAATLGVKCTYGKRMRKTKSFKCKMES